MTGLLDTPGTWRELFSRAQTLTKELETRLKNAQWTFGGGTVLMLRLNHRRSKDIDLFVPDPQYLGYVNPRLSDVAERVSTEYEEAAEFVKLVLAEGEIDIVSSNPLVLTTPGYEVHPFGNGIVRVETSAEIVAKKMHYRGDRAKARDLFDLCAVACHDPTALRAAFPYFQRHGRAFLSNLARRQRNVELEFDAIDTITFQMTLAQCLSMAEDIIEDALGGKPWVPNPPC